MKNIFLISIILLNLTSFSQEKANTPNIKNQELTINTGNPITEHTIYLLRNELKSDSNILKYIDIKHRENKINIIALQNNLKTYIVIFDKYFSKYKIICNNKIIYNKSH